MSRDWGEGASDAGDPGGIGAQAEPGDATWIHTFYNTSFWTTPGGDFSPTLSATTTVSTVDTTYTWSGSGLVADVQAWVSNPASNFGWVIRGDEVNAGSAQRFNTRENSSNPPQLTVTYQVSSPTPTPSPTPTGTPTATPALVSISGTVTYCSNPTLPPVPNVTMTLTGTSSGSTLTNGSGVYTFSSLPSGGNYTVTPTKTALTPGSAGINTVDVVAIQRHVLGLGTPLTGCKLAAADVNPGPPAGINTVDVIAVQRFAVGLSTGIANTGKYQFTPTNRSYTGIVTNQTGQNYDTIVFGDVATGFVHRPEGPEGPSQPAAGDEMSGGEVASTVAAVALPEVAVAQSKSNFIAAVRTSEIDAKNKLVGFQGDLTFDERVVTFQSQPVQAAGLTGTNWNVTGNVLAGAGPDQDAARLGLLERLHAAVRVGDTVRTEDDEGETGSAKHAIDLGGATGRLDVHRRRSEHAEGWQRSAWQRHPIDLFCRAGSLTPPGFGVFYVSTSRNALAGSATPPYSAFASRGRGTKVF